MEKVMIVLSLVDELGERSQSST